MASTDAIHKRLAAGFTRAEVLFGQATPGAGSESEILIGGVTYSTVAKDLSTEESLALHGDKDMREVEHILTRDQAGLESAVSPNTYVTWAGTRYQIEDVQRDDFHFTLRTVYRP